MTNNLGIGYIARCLKLRSSVRASKLAFTAAPTKRHLRFREAIQVRLNVVVVVERQVDLNAYELQVIVAS